MKLLCVLPIVLLSGGWTFQKLAPNAVEWTGPSIEPGGYIDVLHFSIGMNLNTPLPPKPSDPRHYFKETPHDEP